MKRIYSFLALVLMFVAAACNKENTLENLNAIQSVSFVPVYSDGSIKAPEEGILTIDCIVTPAAAVKGLSAQDFKVIVAKAATKAADYSTFEAASVDIDGSTGAVTIKADVSSIFPLDRGNSLAAALNVRADGIDFTSSFINVASTDNSLGLEPIPSVKQVEMTVVVPIHSSSLEYFDYVVRYSDNYSTVETDTVRYNGIEVEDYTDMEVGIYSAKTRGSLDNNDCYTRTFSYDDLPVISTVTVEMIPKKEKSSKASFYFYTPKPYIFPNVHYSITSVKREIPYRIMDGLEQIRIDNMSISSFQSVYGTTFLSRCGIYNYADGYEYFFY
ncbi:MAG: hypothetical protein Q4E55_07640 [Bacteroidales bacterium]|nr:hypothetical protein [Bacteroidales bacterium]